MDALTPVQMVDIRDVCYAACCGNTTVPEGCTVSIHASEQDAIEARGAVVEHGLIKPPAGSHGCPFQDCSTHLCNLHFTADKPFGCRASPFTLNRGNTLIVRQRYTRLKCFRDWRKLPAYVAFRASLDLILGVQQAASVCEHLASGGGDVTCMIEPLIYQILKDNDRVKREYKARNERIQPCNQRDL
jgi:hypothetical protein